MHEVEAHGARIPALGFGTWQLSGDVARSMVETALEIGYRHIDTAQMYGNEAEVGAAIRESGVPREEIFLTTKVWPDKFRKGVFQRSVEESLRRLGLPSVDLLLLHWPNAEVPLSETMGALDEVRERGWAKHVGISNFTTRLIDEALACARSPLVTDQVEYHPFLSQAAVLEKLRGNGMALTAYCPLARGKIFGNPTLEGIAKRHDKSVGQVALRWLVQQPGVIAIPRSSKPEHARANWAIFDFALSDEEMNEIAALGAPGGRVVDVAGVAPAWD